MTHPNTPEWKEHTVNTDTLTQSDNGRATGYPLRVKLHPHRYYRLTYTYGDSGLTITESYDPYHLATLMYAPETSAPGVCRELAHRMVDDCASGLRRGTVECDGESVAFSHSKIPPQGTPQWYEFISTLCVAHIDKRVTPMMVRDSLVRILKG